LKVDMILFLAIILSGFFVGHLVTAMVRGMSGGTLPAWFQDIQAWLAILGMLGLAFVLLIRLVVDWEIPSTKRFGVELDIILATIVALYFGSRS
jgi:hypothetical protein